jgi:hypothetical protein
MEFIAVWLGELDEELSTARQALADAINAQRKAEEIRDTARSELVVQRDTLAVIVEPLARGLADRLRWADQHLHELDVAAKSAEVGVTNARRVVGEAHAAAEQLKLVAARYGGDGVADADAATIALAE